MVVLEAVLNFFVSYGYVFLLLATAFENIPVLGIFLPGEVIVVAAGFFASSGDFNLTTVMIIAGIGAFLGTNVSYGLGYWGGRALLEKIVKRLGVDVRRLADADRYFDSHGPVTVFIGRYMSGVKAFIPALAGAHHMSYWRFMVFSALGIVSWTVIATCLGFYFGRNWEMLMGIIKAVGWVVPTAVALGLGWFWYARKKRSAVSSEEE